MLLTMENVPVPGVGAFAAAANGAAAANITGRMRDRIASSDGAELQRDRGGADFLPARFGPRVDEVVQRLGSFRRKHEIAADGELHAVRIEMAEQIRAHARIARLRRVRRIDRNPAFAFDVELGPAVIALDLTVSGGEREADHE